MTEFMPLSGLLDAAEAAAPVDAVLAVTRELGTRLQALSVSFLVVDTSGRALVRLTHVPLADESPAQQAAQDHNRRDADELAEPLPFDGGPRERVVRSQRLQVLSPADGSGWTVLAPVTERGEVIGILEVALPDEPSTAITTEIATLAHLLAFVVIANRRHTDLFEWGQRSRPLSLSAEIQQRLLPGPRTCEAGAFTLSGWLEPAAEIAGDTFDYSLARDTLHLSMTDAMGHGVGAALTATLCLGALRGSRRRGRSLAEQARNANAAVLEHGTRSGAGDFVTGLLARVDLPDGLLHVVNAGHVAPYLARGEDVQLLDLPVCLPFGLFPDTAYQEMTLQLEPGDRLVLVTDGMLERGAEKIDLPRAVRDSAGLHPREAVAFLADSVLVATGHALSDDATTLCLDWYGGHGHPRTTSAGSDVLRATSDRHRFTARVSG
jgi:serine phosphatase RsbU (regulator of sigma subunit)